MDRNPLSRNGKSPVSSANNLGDAKELRECDFIFPVDKI